MVDPLDPGDDLDAGLGAGRPAAAVEDVLLEESEERFHGGVEDDEHRRTSPVTLEACGRLGCSRQWSWRDFDAKAGDTPIVFIPDAGLLGASGQEWQSFDRLAAYHRTPFKLLGPDGCAELRSLPQDWPIRPTCDIDGVRIDFLTLQGCEREGTYYAAVGRACTFFDFDINATWEQWWIEAPAEDYGNGPFVLETDGTTELWRITHDSHRDDRCQTPPNEWPTDWRYEG